MAGIYLHIPFCQTRCIYCDFYSTTQMELKSRYVEALCTELKSRGNYLNGDTIETIYFGGGTPSQLSYDDFEKIFSAIDSTFGLQNVKEVTLEANPDDLSPNYLKELAALPFNRLSVGIQTFSDTTLQILKRRHTASQAVVAVENARKAGFRNISIDLMYGLPDETTKNWLTDLNQAIDLYPEHISAYHLTYEEGTILRKLLQENKIREVDEDKSLLFFQLLIEKLKEAGYEHYEISNFCLPGKYSQHNTSYWQGIPYLGIGASAHSYNGNSREWNVSSIQSYIKGIETDNRSFEIEELDKDTCYNDYIITSLRTRWGISLNHLQANFGGEYVSWLLHIAEKYLRNETLKKENEHLILTQSGIFVSDNIMSDLLRVPE
ncbi:MAG: radical SAM family heme chaperone HemW [Bacteroides sp.]|nr:radical SAM family heme chaperone HemW [Bacteroides sp.]